MEEQQKKEAADQDAKLEEALRARRMRKQQVVAEKSQKHAEEVL